MSTVVLLVALGLLIGVVLGGLGGGGAVLTVPGLVFLVGQTTQQAATSSLVIVGLSSAVGVAAHLRAGHNCCRIGWRLALTLTVAGIPAAWAGSHLSHAIDGTVLLLGFSGLMLAAAAAMWWEIGTGGRRRALAPGTRLPRSSTDHEGAVLLAEPEVDLARQKWPLLVAGGTGVGLITGFFGVGGGFVIVPTLVALYGLPLNIAAGTSLVVVALNSAVALVARASVAEFDWSVILPFTVAAMVASVLARRVAIRLRSRHVARGFALVLAVVAVYTATTSVLTLT